MKKIFYLASIAALAFSSCAKDETTEANLGTVGGSKIVAAMEADDTRTQLDANGTYKWSAGDQLGVYGIGAHTLNNAAFVLDNSAANSAVGVFASQSTELEAGKTYLAVYPRLQKSIISQVNQEDVLHPSGLYYTKQIKASDVKVEILDEQKYQNGSFYTNTAPAISSSFVVDADGADVEMQPVVDYLFVNIKSTEPIEELTLTLKNATKTFTLAGHSTLTGYWYGNEYRYYAGEPAGDQKTIKLQTDESYKSIVCHEPNTYVFVVPAGILGMGDGVEAIITVNDGTNTNWRLLASNSDLSTKPDYTSLGGGYYGKPGTIAVSNFDLNYRWVDANGNYVAESSEIHDRTKTSGGRLVYRQENTVFWMNPVDAYGNRTSFMYNPHNDYIIENEGQLLKYLYDYAAGSTTADALICNEHEFDFSQAHMKVISSEMTKTTSKYYPYQTYINRYYMGKFPTIETYAANFNGAGAVIEGIENALDNGRGIFGTITGKIENVTFDGVKTADVEIVEDELYTKGLVLGTITTGSIDNVTVKNADAFAILGAAKSAAWDELTVDGVANLNYIVANMTLSKDLDLTEDWATLKGVKNSVFGTLMAESNNSDYHHVVKLPADADYADLAFDVNAETPFSFAVTNQLVLNTVDFGTRAAAVVNDNKVVSVLVGETSVWTGDKFDLGTYMSNAKVAPKTYTKATDKVNDWAVNGYYKLEYAEQLATGATETINAVVMRNMDLSKAVNEWAPVTVNHLEGGNNTINGVKMTVWGVEDQHFGGSASAPLAANKLTNIKVNDIKLNVKTQSDTYVPNVIGGVVNLIGTNPLVDNVKVDGLTITGEGEGANNEQYKASNHAIIGWLVGDATDATIEDSEVLNVKNEIIGIAGLVGRMNITTTANIQNSSATVTSMVQTTLSNFKNVNKAATTDAFAKSNFAGTAVGYVYAESTSEPVIIKFENVGKPVFGYGTRGAQIKVLYDAGEADVVLKSNSNYAW